MPINQEFLKHDFAILEYKELTMILLESRISIVKNTEHVMGYLTTPHCLMVRACDADASFIGP